MAFTFDKTVKQGNHAVHSLFSFELVWGKAHVDNCAIIHRIVWSDNRIDECRGAFPILSTRRRGGIRKRSTGTTSVGCSRRCCSCGYIRRVGCHTALKAPSIRQVQLCRQFAEHLNDLASDVIYIGVVIPVFRSMVNTDLTKFVITRKIGFQSLNELAG